MKNRLMAVMAGILVMLTGSLAISSPAMAVVTYHYAVGQQTGIVADGAAVNMTVHSPYVNGAHDGTSSHSIAELTVRSADSKDRIEVGWRKPTVSPVSMFVYHAINGVGQGYNLCTDQAGTAFNAGDAIPAAVIGTSPRFQILHSGTKWWIQFNAQWICTFDDSVWTSQGRTFNKVEQVQAFGEVASNVSATPCTDMGNNQASTGATAARIENYALQGQTSGPAAAFSNYVQPAGVGITQTVVSTTAFKYGWAGYTSTNTLPGNYGSC